MKLNVDTCSYPIFGYSRRRSRETRSVKQVAFQNRLAIPAWAPGPGEAEMGFSATMAAIECFIRDAPIALKHPCSRPTANFRTRAS